MNNHNNMADWQLAYVLPNLNPKNPFEAKGIALTCYQDPRVKNIMRRCDLSKRLLNGFIDINKNSIQPAAIIYDKDIMDNEWVAPCIDFRNIVAISVLLRGWANNRVGEQFNSSILFADYFKICHTIGNKDRYVTKTPDTLSVDISSRKFFGMRTSYLPPYNPHPVKYPDDKIIYYALRKFWEDKYIKNKPSTVITKLFRSLEIAFYASSMNIENRMSKYDHGISVPLWVSAWEILYNYENKDISKWDIIKKIKEYQWSEPYLDSRYFNVSQEKGSLVQKICYMLYELRNDFIHGNPLNEEKYFLKPCHKKKELTLLRFPPLVYRTALFIFLNNNLSEVGGEKLNIKKLFYKWCQIRYKEYIWEDIQNSYEECLLQLQTCKK